MSGTGFKGVQHDDLRDSFYRAAAASANLKAGQTVDLAEHYARLNVLLDAPDPAPLCNELQSTAELLDDLARSEVSWRPSVTISDINTLKAEARLMRDLRKHIIGSHNWNWRDTPAQGH